MPNLTLSMIVKNEEKYLRECLESVNGVVDEIVIADTGSTDNTIAIAEEFNAKVIHFKWIDDFSAARNFALKNSSGDWILYLDADERLLPESIEELKKISKTKDKIGWRCLVDCPDSHNDKPSAIKYPRLFKNSSSIQFTGSVHEQIIESLRKNNYKIKDSEIKILHVGYDVPYEELQEKARRNLRLLLKDFEKTKSIYSAFQIAQSYGVLDDVPNVKKYFGYIINEPKSPALYKSNAYRYLAAKELDENNVTKALNFAHKGLEYSQDEPILFSLLAKLYVIVGDYQTALEFVIKAVENNSPNTNSDFKLTVNPRNLLYLALQVAALAQDKNSFNLFVRKLEEINSTELEQNSLIRFVQKLFNGIQISTNELNEFSKYVSSSNSNLLFTLIDQYPYLDTKIELLSRVSENMQNVPEFLNTFGHALLEAGNFNRAKSLFERSISISIKDPSVIFYLVSIYVQLNQFENIESVILKAEETFNSIPVVMEKINILKSKLSQLIT